MAYTGRRSSSRPSANSLNSSRRGRTPTRSSPRKLQSTSKSKANRPVSAMKQTVSTLSNIKSVKEVAFSDDAVNYLTPAPTLHSCSSRDNRSPLEVSEERSHTPSYNYKEPGAAVVNSCGEIIRYRTDTATIASSTKPVDKGKGPFIGNREAHRPTGMTQIPLKEANERNISKLALEISGKPRVLNVDELAGLFKHLQQAISHFSGFYFSQSLTVAEIAAFPLATLEETHPALVRLTQHIADGSQYTWRRFLTSPNTRPHLVNGMIAEILRCHIFDATAFGIPAHHVAQLEKDVDVAYRQYDGFVRTKARAKKLEHIFSSQMSVDAKLEMAHAAVDASHTLTKQIYMHLLEPLFLPVSVVEKYNLELIEALLAIIRIAMDLHQCIRLSGRDGLLLSYRPIPTGTHQQPSKTHPIDRVNQKFLETTRHHARSEAVPVVKLCVFPAVVAYVPTGPTKLELDCNPKLAKSLPKLPKELQNPTKVRWDIQKKQQKPQRQQRNEPKRGSYVTMQLLNVPQVYCEWTPRSADERLAPNGAAELEKNEGLTLIEAIDEAHFELNSGRRRRSGHGGCRGNLIAAAGVTGAALTAGLIIAAAAATTTTITGPKSLTVQGGGSGGVLPGLLSQVRLHASDGNLISSTQALAGFGNFLSQAMHAVREFKPRRGLPNLPSVRALLGRFSRDVSEPTIKRFGSFIDNSAGPDASTCPVEGNVLKKVYKVMKSTTKVRRGF